MEGQSPVALTEESLAQSVEAKETQAPQETKADPLASRFSALAKREKSLVRMRQEMAEERARIEAERKEIDRYKSLYEQAKKDPRKILEEVGWSYDRLTEAHLNDYKPTPESEIHSVKEQLQALRQEREQEKTKAQEMEEQRQKDEFLAQVKEAKGAIAKQVKDLGDEFEFINSFGEHDLVYETMMEIFNKTGRMVEVVEAAKIVEDYIEEQEVKKIAETKKFKSKYMKQEDPKETPPANEQKPSVSLSHTQTASPMGFTSPKTEAERMQRALAALDRKV